MSVPGSNLLSRAARLIAQQTVSYQQWTGRTQNENYEWISTYAPAVNIQGSFQPVPRSMYEKMNLDWQKDYFNFFCQKDMLDLNRDVSGDIFAFNGSTFKIESSTDWFAMDGWAQVLCVRMPVEVA